MCVCVCLTKYVKHQNYFSLFLKKLFTDWLRVAELIFYPALAFTLIYFVLKNYSSGNAYEEATPFDNYFGEGDRQIEQQTMANDTVSDLGFQLSHITTYVSIYQNTNRIHRISFSIFKNLTHSNRNLISVLLNRCSVNWTSVSISRNQALITKRSVFAFQITVPVTTTAVSTFRNTSRSDDNRKKLLII